METRKSIDNVKNNQEIAQHDDLTVQGNVGNHSMITITDGSLIIFGDVEESACIKLKLSEELRSQFLSKNEISSSLLSFIGVKSDVKANSMSFINGKGIYSGNVRVGNRIFTDDTLIMYADNKYEIIPRDDFGNIIIGVNNAPQECKNRIANATIDGKQYKGMKIIVEGEHVIVDGVNMTNVNKNYVNTTLRRKDKPIFIIHGNVGNNVLIDSDVDIVIEGRVGKSCQIISEYGGIRAKDIGTKSSLNMHNDISVAEIGDGCELTSKYQSLSATNLGERVLAKSYKNITVHNIGSDSDLMTEYGEITATNVKNNVTINAYKSVKLIKTGDKCNIKSQYESINVTSSIGEKSVIKAYKDVEIVGKAVYDTNNLVNFVGNCVRNNCKIVSEYRNITVYGNVGASVKIEAYKDLVIKGHVGRDADLSSSYESIKISGCVGSGGIIHAYKDIIAQDVDEKSSLTSDYRGITVCNVGVNVKIYAYKDIFVNGYCANQDKIKSSYGKVKIVDQAHFQQQFLQAPQQYNDEKFELDTQKAIELSRIDSPNNSIKVNNTLSIEKAKEIPIALCCPISHQVMINPVLCILDDTTYDMENIKEWLINNRSSPINRKEMEPLKQGEKIEGVVKKLLIPNRAIRDMIDTYRSENPEIFKEASSEKSSIDNSKIFNLAYNHLPNEIYIDSKETRKDEGRGIESPPEFDLGNSAINHFMSSLYDTIEGSLFKKFTSFLTEDGQLEVTSPDSGKIEYIKNYKIKINDNLSLSPGEIIDLSGKIHGESEVPISFSDNPSDLTLSFMKSYEIFIKKYYDTESIRSIKCNAQDNCHTETFWKLHFVKNDKQYSESYIEKSCNITFWNSGSFSSAINNFDHFGKYAKKCYTTGHKIAIVKAMLAGKDCNIGSFLGSIKNRELNEFPERSSSIEMLKEAFIYEFMACHYLLNLISATHMRIPRVEMLNYLESCDKDIQSTPNLESVSHLNLAIAGLLAKSMSDDEIKNGFYVTHNNESNFTYTGGNYSSSRDRKFCARLAFNLILESMTDLLKAFHGYTVSCEDILNKLPALDHEENNYWGRQPLFSVKDNNKVICRLDEHNSDTLLTPTNIPLLAHSLFKITFKNNQNNTNTANDALKEASLKEIEQVYSQMRQAPDLKCTIF